MFIYTSESLGHGTPKYLSLGPGLSNGQMSHEFIIVITSYKKKNRLINFGIVGVPSQKALKNSHSLNHPF